MDDTTESLGQFGKDMYYTLASGGAFAWGHTFEIPRAISIIEDVAAKLEPEPRVFFFSGDRGLQFLGDKEHLPIYISKLPGNELMPLRQHIAGDEDLLEEMGSDFNIEFEDNEEDLALENFGYTIDAAISDALRVPSTPEEPVIVILCEFDKFMTEPRTSDLMKLRVREYQRTGSALIVLSNNPEPPDDLKRIVKQIEMPLPTAEEFDPLIDVILQNAETKEDKASLLNGFSRTEIARALTGLTLKEGEDALAECAARYKVMDPKILGKIKAVQLAKDGLIEFIDVQDTLSDFGGYYDLVEWIKENAAILCDDAYEFGCEELLGLLLMGPPGTGKTKLAQILGWVLKRPCVIAHFERCFGSLVGETERNVSRMFATIRAMSPVVVIYDEIEGLLSGREGSGKTDGGTTSRAVSTVLSELGAARKGIASAMTSNDPRSLPPQLMRKGRISEIFYVGLPNYEERIDILKIHVKKRSTARNGLNSSLDIEKVAAATKGFSGADLEELVKTSIRSAYVKQKDEGVTVELILDEINRTKPCSELFKKQLASFEAWVQEVGARNASRPSTKKPPKGAKRKRKVQYK